MSAVRTIRILKAARKLLARKGGWTKDAFARDKYGRAVRLKSAKAISFCSWGAIERVTTTNVERLLAHVALPVPSGYISLSSYNDQPQRTQKQILTLFDRAIARLERYP